MLNLKKDPKIVINELKIVHIYDRSIEERNEIIEFLTKIDIKLSKEYLYHVLDKDFVLYTKSVWYKKYDVEVIKRKKNQITYDFMNDKKFEKIFEVISNELLIRCNKISEIYNEKLKQTN